MIDRLELTTNGGIAYMLLRLACALTCALLALLVAASAAAAAPLLYRVTITQQACSAQLGSSQQCVTFRVDGLTTAARFQVVTDQGVRFSGAVSPASLPLLGLLGGCVLCNEATTTAADIGANCGTGTCPASFNLDDGQRFAFTVPTFRTATVSLPAPAPSAATPSPRPGAGPSVSAQAGAHITGAAAAPAPRSTTAASATGAAGLAPVVPPTPLTLAVFSTNDLGQQVAVACTNDDLLAGDVECRSASVSKGSEPPSRLLLWPVALLGALLIAWRVWLATHRRRPRTPQPALGALYSSTRPTGRRPQP